MILSTLGIAYLFAFFWHDYSTDIGYKLAVFCELLAVVSFYIVLHGTGGWTGLFVYDLRLIWWWMFVY